MKLVVAAFIALGLAGDAAAHGAQGHGQRHALGPYPVVQTEFGIAGHPKKLSRTVLVEFDDRLRYAPDTLRVKQGDTVRFVLRNRGRQRHDWVLGTEQELARAGAPEAVHRLHVEPGATEQMVWQFNRPGTFRFASPAPAASFGTVRVEPAAPR